jgi:hypothetical protein
VVAVVAEDDEDMLRVGETVTPDDEPRVTEEEEVGKGIRVDEGVREEVGVGLVEDWIAEDGEEDGC